MFHRCGDRVVAGRVDREIAEGWTPLTNDAVAVLSRWKKSAI